MNDARTLADVVSQARRRSAPVMVHGLRGSIAEATNWGELAEGAFDLARRLPSAGLKVGQRVAMEAETSLGFIRLFLGCQLAGLVPVPMPLASVLGDTGAHREAQDRMIKAAGAALFMTPAEARTLPLSRRKPPSLAPQDIAFIQFSSGSTRLPKGVVLTQSAVMANLRAMGNGLAVRPDDICVSWLPLYHDMGLVGCLLAPLLAGVPLHLLPTREFIRAPLAWPRLMAEFGGTISYGPASGYDLAARRASPDALAGMDLSRWRVAGLGADMIRPQMPARFAATFAAAGFNPKAFVASYGLAEASLCVSMARPGDGLSTLNVAGRELARCGKPVEGVSVRVCDEAGQEVAPGQVGRLLVRGLSVMEAYFGDPMETARVLSPDKWLDTGDLGLLADGEVVVTGRSKDLIIMGGRNLWPQDLEWAAEGVDPLRPGDVAAVGVDGADGAEQAVLLVQCRLAQLDAREKLAQRVAAAVLAAAGVLCPVVLVPPHALPRTSSGKLARAHARRLLVEGRFP